MLPLAGDASGTQMKESAGNYPRFPPWGHNALKRGLIKANQLRVNPRPPGKYVQPFLTKEWSRINQRAVRRS
jgi:hypothetical protein